MANIAECAIRIATKDLPKVKKVVRKAPKDAKTTYIVEAFYSSEQDETNKYKCILKDAGAVISPRIDQIAEAYKSTSDGDWAKIEPKDLPQKDITLPNGEVERRIDFWYTGSQPIKWEEVLATNDGGQVLLDLAEVYKLSGEWPGIYELNWAEIGTETLELLFSAKWGFPSALETALNKLAYDNDGEVIVHWQGAESEPGCEVENDELGTEDLGLCIKHQACCSQCYDIIEECIEEGKKAEDYVCEVCSQHSDKPVTCYSEPYVGAYITNDGKQWKERL